MNALEFFKVRYAGLHGRVTDDLLSDLSLEQQRRRPDPRVNTVAWLLWHVARSEDVGVSRLIADRRQVLDDDGWAAKLGVARRDIGTAWTTPK